MELKNITINIPIKYDDFIMHMVFKETYSSRSEIIRRAIYEFLNNELLFMKDLDKKEDIQNGK